RIVSAQSDMRDEAFAAGPRSEPMELKIWDTASGTELARFDVPRGAPVYSAGRELFSVVLADGQKGDRLLLKSWSVETGKERLSVPLPVSALKQARRRSWTGEVTESVYVPLGFLVFNRDGTNLLVGKGPFGPGVSNIEVVTLIDPQTGMIRATVDNPNGLGG